jgi:hypothetical protein
MHLPSRTVLGAGQKDITIIGPVSDVEAEIAALHTAFWKH